MLRIYLLLQYLAWCLIVPSSSLVLQRPGPDDPDSVVFCPQGTYIGTLDYRIDPFKYESIDCYQPEPNGHLKWVSHLPMKNANCRGGNNNFITIHLTGFLILRATENGTIARGQPDCGGDKGPFCFSGGLGSITYAFGRTVRCPYNYAACGFKAMHAKKGDCTSPVEHISFACCEHKIP